MVALPFHMRACEAGQTSSPASSPHSLCVGFAVRPQQAHRDGASLPGLCVSVTAVHTRRPSGAYLPCVHPLQYNRLAATFLFGFCSFPLSFWGMFIHSRWESFVLYVVCKYFLSASALPLFPSYSKRLLQSIFAFSLNSDFISSWVCFLCLIFCFLILACLWVSWTHF